jgi:heat shock protein HtpX
MNTLRVGLLLAALTALFLAVGYGLGGPVGMGLALAAALTMNLGSYWFSDRIVLRMTGAEPLTANAAPELHRMTERLAQAAGIPTPRLYRVPDPQPNAFATGRSPAHGVVAVNDGLLDLLDRREVEGVIAHEIAHIAHRDTLTMAVVASLAGAVMWLVELAQWAYIFGGSEEEEGGPGAVEVLAAALLAPVAAMLVQMGVSRAREFEADATAAQLAGTPDGLIGALQKLERGAELIPAHAVPPQAAHMQIVNGLGGGRLAGGLARLFATHPPVEARVERLRAMAGYGTLSRRRVPVA